MGTGFNKIWAFKVSIGLFGHYYFFFFFFFFLGGGGLNNISPAQNYTKNILYCCIVVFEYLGVGTCVSGVI